jgi:hypothetical protein
VPLLMECDAMPNRLDLAAELQADLGALWAHNALALGGEQQRWDQAIHGLLTRLKDLLQLQPLPTADEDLPIDAARKAVKGLLAQDEMAPLRQRWGSDPLAGLALAQLEDLLVVFAQQIEKAHADWRAMHLQGQAFESVRQHCRDIVATLYGLAIDGDAARAWVEEPSCLRPVPVASAGALVFAYAAVHGLKAGMAASDVDLAGFVPQDVVDFGLPDPGATDARRAMLHQRMWRATFTDPRVDYPAGQGPLAAEQRDTLRRRMLARRRIHQRAPIATEVHREAGAQTDLQLLADELGMVALPRTGEDKGLLRVDERDFNALVAEVLACIERIPSA